MSFFQNTTYTVHKKTNTQSMIEVTGHEPAASCSQSKRATNCATPRTAENGHCAILTLICTLCQLKSSIKNSLQAFKTFCLLCHILKEATLKLIEHLFFQCP